VLNASVDVVFNRADVISSVFIPIAVDVISSICGVVFVGIVQRRTLLLGFYTNPTGLELRSSWFRCEHLTKVI